MRSTRIAGLILIALGVALLVALTTDVGGEAIVGFLGVAFLVAYATTRAYGYLVPGGILTGLGAGLTVESLGGPSASVLLGLGGGFLAIALIHRLVGSAGAAWWWPLIPGGVLTVVGVSNLPGTPNLGRYLVPIALIAIGSLLLLRRGTDRRDDDGRDVPAADGAAPTSHS